MKNHFTNQTQTISNGRTEQSGATDSESQIVADLNEIENNPKTWKPQSKMSQAMARIPVLKKQKENAV